MMLQTIRSLLNRSSFSFQILSDLHLEVNRQYSSFEIPVCSSRLILAGDIGRLVDYDDYRDFLQRQTERFERVFLVLGNHEFYNTSFAAGLEKAKQLEKEPSLNGRLIILHQKRYDVPNSHLTILGCTLWSKVPNETRDVVRAKVNDFQKIEEWTVDNHNAAYDSDIFWLRQQVRLIHKENDQPGKLTPKRLILIVTHHAPSLRKTSSPRNTQNSWNSAFATDILSEYDWNGVKIWVFGHTHHTTEFKEAHVRVVSNQRGYVLPWSSDPKKSNRKYKFDVKRVIWT